MREILFRGKRLDNGEWAEGFIVASRENTYPNGFEMITVDGINYDELDNYIPDFISYAVDPSTVGQYTGLKDKNGKRIWEGDVLRSRYDDLYPDDESIEVVKWFRNGWHIQQGEYTPDAMDGDGVMPYSEVIGNITDNPELLEK